MRVMHGLLFFLSILPVVSRADLCELILAHADNPKLVRDFVDFWADQNRIRSADFRLTAEINDSLASIHLRFASDPEPEPMLVIPGYRDTDFHSYPVTAIAFGPTDVSPNYLLASGDRDGVVKVWNLNFPLGGGPGTFRLGVGHTHHRSNVAVSALGLSAEHPWVASAAGPEILVTNMANGEEIARLNFPEVTHVTELRLTEEWIYAIGKQRGDKFLRVWDSSGKPRMNGAIKNVCDLSAVSDRVALIQKDEIKLLDSNAVALRTIGAKNDLRWHTFSPTGALFIVESKAAQTLNVFRTSSPNPLLIFPLSAKLVFASFSKDEKLLAVFTAHRKDRSEGLFRMQVVRIETGDVLADLTY
jgi:WD40 repeat protein